MTTNVNSISVTIPNPTSAQVLALAEIMAATEETATPKRKRAAKPADTDTADDEEEVETAADTDEEESDEEEESEEDDEEESDDEQLTFDDVTKALNKYGNKNPKGAKALLLSFGIKSTKELEKSEKKWEPVYRKLMAKIKAAKK